jgi:hypothetical protein
MLIVCLQILASLAIPLQPFYVVPNTGYVVDAKLYSASSCIALETTDEDSFTYILDANGENTEALSANPKQWIHNGETILKRRALVAAGWSVLEIPFFEWPQERFNQEAYLGRKLASVGYHAEFLGVYSSINS